MKETLPNEHLLRELAPQVLGAVVRRFRDFATAEDAVQEALIAAFNQWPRDGVPENPRGWLIQVASRRMTDQVRTEIARRERETSVVRDAETMVLADEIEPDMDMDPNDTLILLHVLPPCPDFVLDDCPDAACRRRSNYSGNCQCIPGSRSDNGAADQPREAKHQGFRRAIQSASSRGPR